MNTFWYIITLRWLGEFLSQFNPNQANAILLFGGGLLIGFCLLILGKIAKWRGWE